MKNSFKKNKLLINTFLKYTFFSSSLITIVTTLGVILVLSKESIEFFKLVSPIDFLFGTNWAPLLDPQSFGILPLVSGTMMVMIGSGIIAIPMGLISAVYLSEYSSNKTRDIIRPILEILAGIPTIVYGFFALTFITPVIQLVLPDTQVFNGLSGAIVVGIMILPMVSSLCFDAFQAIPKDIKMGGYALGTTSFETIFGIIIPDVWPRIVSAFILSLSRAIGETMAVTLASGANPNLSFNPLKGIQTMTAYIVQVSLGDAEAGGPAYLTSFAVALVLFVMTLCMNIFGFSLTKKFYKTKKKKIKGRRSA